MGHAVDFFTMDRSALPDPDRGAPASSALTPQFQSFGVVVVIDADACVRHVSSACEALLGRDAEQLVGLPLADVVGGDGAAAVTNAIAGAGRPRVQVEGATLEVRVFHPGGGLVGLDLLPLERPAGSEADAVEHVSAWNERLMEADSVEALVEIATTAAGERTGFDGAWICRTERDDNTATVLSARVPEGTPTAVGTLVKPSDMPPRLLDTRGRPVGYFVVDLSAPMAELVPPAPGLDLTGSALVLPFPDWLRWLASVGPRATVGIPIVVNGRPWGWVLAHDPTAVRVPTAVQAELRLLGVVFGTRLAELIALEETHERLELSHATRRVLQAVAAADDLAASLRAPDSALPGVSDASSVVVDIGGRRDVVGEDLSPEVVAQVLDLARERLGRPDAPPVVASTTLGGTPALDAARAAGFAAMRLDHAAEHVVVWVRGERRRAIRWVEHAVVGDVPQEELFTGLGERLEEEQGSCAPWTPAQLHEIDAVRETLAEVFVARYGAMQTLTAELARSNDEYDTFAHAAAHDLKTPLRGIRQSMEFFLEDTAGAHAPDDEALLHTVVRLSDRMAAMLDDLMAYAQVGRDPWTPTPLDLAAAVADARDLLGERLDGATVQVEPGTFTTDPGALRQLLLNLLGNAAKYSEGPADIRVRVTTLAEVATCSPPASLGGAAPATEVLVVADQGIGIDPSHHARIFGLFHQLDPSAAGTGTGLALCRLICRRHGGEIWLTSAPGQGTTFYVTSGAPTG